MTKAEAHVRNLINRSGLTDHWVKVRLADLALDRCTRSELAQAHRQFQAYSRDGLAQAIVEKISATATA